MPHEATALLQKTPIQAFETLFNDAQKHIQQANAQSGFTRKDRIWLSMSGLLAAVSAIMYWLSTDEGGKRYAHYLGWPAFLDLVSASSAITNGAFNFESYLTLIQAYRAQTSAEEKQLTGIKSRKGEWLLGTVMAFFAVLPLWYQGEKDAPVLALKILDTISTLLNLPVNTDGSVNFIRDIRCLDLKDRLYGSVFHRAELHQTNAALRKIRALIAARLEQQTIGSLNTEASWTKNFAALLTTNTVVKSKTPSSVTKYLWLGSCWLLGISSMASNFGPAVETSNTAGSLWGWSPWKIACLVLNLVPAIGFTVKGFFKLLDVAEHFMQGTKPEVGVEAPVAYTGLLVLFFVITTFSGFTTDQMNYDAWIQVFKEKIGAIVLGVMSNLGTAFAYNLPQCLFLVERMLSLYFTKRGGNESIKKQMACQEALKTLAGVVREMPLEVFGELLKSEVFRGFLVHARDKGDISSTEFNLIDEPTAPSTPLSQMA